MIKVVVVISRLGDLEKNSIERLKMFDPSKYENRFYKLCYSGGKDSDVLLALARLSGVKFEGVHNLTTVDAPETVYHVKKQPDVKILRPPLSMWQLIVKKRMPPTRLCRYCCSELKERYGACELLLLGVRKSESVNRSKNTSLVNFLNKPKTTQKLADTLGADYELSKYGTVMLNNDNDESRELVEQCSRMGKTCLNIIYDWTTQDVWDFIKYYGIELNPLYDLGYNRVGCIGCPLGGRKRQLIAFRDYPTYKENYIKAFDRMVKKRVEDGLETQWKDGEEVFSWWVQEDQDQIMFDLG